MDWGGPKMVGIILIVEAVIPLGDMSMILTVNGSTKTAFGIHGFTALLMMLAGVPLALGTVRRSDEGRFHKAVGRGSLAETYGVRAGRSVRSPSIYVRRRMVDISG